MNWQHLNVVFITSTYLMNVMLTYLSTTETSTPCGGWSLKSLKNTV